MCGIYFFKGGAFDLKELYRRFQQIKHRGPDRSAFRTFEYTDKEGVKGKVALGFHRLVINGTGVEADQPITRRDVTLVCNGEIYNHRQLQPEHKGSDCNVIIDLYKKYGASVELLHQLDGVYSFILIDWSRGTVVVARDRFGVRPLFTRRGSVTGEIVLEMASEAKALQDSSGVEQFPSGEVQEFSLESLALLNRHCLPLQMSDTPIIGNTSINQMRDDIRQLLERAVEKRVHNSDRPVGLFLSGGLDSSLVASIASRYGVKDSFSIGLTDSSDLKKSSSGS